MSDSTLELEKQLLLEKMRTSRVLVQEKFLKKNNGDAAATDEFPRSHTLKLLTQHPLWIGVAALAFFVLGRRRFVRSTLKTGITLAGGVLSNAASLSLVIRMFPQLFPAAVGFIQFLKKLKPDSRKYL